MTCFVYFLTLWYNFWLFLYHAYFPYLMNLWCILWCHEVLFICYDVLFNVMTFWFMTYLLASWRISYVMTYFWHHGIRSVFCDVLTCFLTLWLTLCWRNNVPFDIMTYFSYFLQLCYDVLFNVVVPGCSVLFDIITYFLTSVIRTLWGTFSHNDVFFCGMTYCLMSRRTS